MTQQPNDITRDRLLDQAERLFAEKGYDAVSVRTITHAAECNLAAVNYHFGSKMTLYLEVFRQRWVPRTRRIRGCVLSMLSETQFPEVKDVARAVACAFLEGPISDEERRRHVQLMQREMTTPTEALDMVVNEVMVPFQKELGQFVRPHLPADVDEESLRLSLLSILGMTLYFTIARPAVSRLTGREYDDAFKSRLIDHITAFSIDGINALKKD